MKKFVIFIIAIICLTSCSTAFWGGVIQGMAYSYNTDNSYSSSSNGNSSGLYASQYGNYSPYLYSPIQSQSVTSTPSSTSSGATSHTRVAKTCAACSGTGRIIEYKTASFGLEKYCAECKKTVPSNHYHVTCPSCKGQGKW